MKTNKRRLFFDIETSPNVVLSWRTGYEISIPHDNILEERSIVCICWKWEGDKEVHGLTWDHRHCDKKMLLEFSKILNSADEAIGHNSDRFDLKWIKTRCLFHRIPMYPNYTTLDTLKIAKKQFNFNSNKLDYIAKFLGFGGKMDTGGFDLWKAVVLDKCKISLAKMVKYCKRDVVLLEKIYQELRTYAPHRFNYAVAYGGERFDCPNCESIQVRTSKTIVSPYGVIKKQMQCKECGTYFTINSKAHEEYEKSK